MNLAYDLPMPGAAGVQVYLNVTDVFNVLPPNFTSSTLNNYDPIGRFYRLGVHVNL